MQWVQALLAGCIGRLLLPLNAPAESQGQHAKQFPTSQLQASAPPSLIPLHVLFGQPQQHYSPSQLKGLNTKTRTC
jgi:hypothetical protein